MDQNQIKDNIHLTRKDKKQFIKILLGRITDVTDQLLEEKAKVEGHKKQNKELAILISSDQLSVKLFLNRIGKKGDTSVMTVYIIIMLEYVRKLNVNTIK